MHPKQEAAVTAWLIGAEKDFGLLASALAHLKGDSENDYIDSLIALCRERETGAKAIHSLMTIRGQNSIS